MVKKDRLFVCSFYFFLGVLSPLSFAAEDARNMLLILLTATIGFGVKLLSDYPKSSKKPLKKGGDLINIQTGHSSTVVTGNSNSFKRVADDSG